MEFTVEVNEVVGQKILEAAEYFGVTSGDYLRIRVIESMAHEHLIQAPGEELKIPLKMFASMGIITCPNCTAKITAEMIESEVCDGCGAPFKWRTT